MSYQYDLAGNRTRITHPDGTYFRYDRDGLGRVSVLRDGPGAALASFSYDDQGRRAQLAYANGTITGYAYDSASRLAQLSHDFAGAAQDVTFAIGIPAGFKLPYGQTLVLNETCHYKVP